MAQQKGKIKEGIPDDNAQEKGKRKEAIPDDNEIEIACLLVFVSRKDKFSWRCVDVCPARSVYIS